MTATPPVVVGPTATVDEIHPARLLPIRLFLSALAVLLVGYMFLGRGFAHIGVPPLYVGELVLALGLACCLAAIIRQRLRVPLSPVFWLLIVFIGLGAVATVPYLSTFRTDALRDAVLWGYALFALMIYLVADRTLVLRAARTYGWIVPVFAAWLPISWNIFGILSDNIDPNAPGAYVPLVFFKSGDMAVHVAGSLALLVLVSRPFTDWRLLAWRTLVALPLIWTIYVTATTNRGALLATVVGVTAIAVLGRRTRNWAPVLVALVLFVASLLPAAIPQLKECDPSGASSPAPSGAQAPTAVGREVNPCQLAQNVTSIVGTTEVGTLEGTKGFRLAWWSTIVDYTVFGPYFWTGKGFGINLADADGFQPTADHSLRAPHNSHISVLARMGVPGFIAWALLQLVFALGLLQAALRLRRSGDVALAGAAGLVLVYWGAMVVDTSFDPYLEGPQGGIWFWVLFGLGMVIMRVAPRRGTA